MDERATTPLEAALAGVGLSKTGILNSIGIHGHCDRVTQGKIASETVARYADDLQHLNQLSKEGDSAIPVDFWDVQSPLMQRTGWDEYRLVHLLCQPAYAEYVAVLGSAYHQLMQVQQQRQTAVRAALNILLACAHYTAAGEGVGVPRSLVRRPSRQHAIALWQQTVTGATRRIPLVGWEVLPPTLWTRYTVAKMWQYQVGRVVSASATWGVSGFHPDFVGRPQNNNQIEHLTISASLQMIWHVPVLALNLVEYGQWLTPPGVPYAEAQADIRLNQAIAHHFVRQFIRGSPAHACQQLQMVLASAAPH